jgi:DNA-nicking Smr family endonuclease
VKRPLKPDEIKVWGMVAATVHPMPGRRAPKLAAAEAPAAIEAAPAHLPPKKPGPLKKPSPPKMPPKVKGPAPAPPTPKAKPCSAIDDIEPRRHHRIAKERDPIGARLDLHGYDQGQARGVLDRFLMRAWDDGLRAVLVITGKGVQGDGILRRRAPEWLAAPHLAHIIAGISEAHRRHGGEGALYVALKRKPRG